MFNQNITSNTEQQIQTHKYQNNTIKPSSLRRPHTENRPETKHTLPLNKQKPRTELKSTRKEKKAVVAKTTFAPKLEPLMLLLPHHDRDKGYASQ